MPHLVRWYDELSDFGLVIIAPHVQQGSEDEIKSKASSLGVRFTVTKGGQLPDHSVGGIPNSVMFDRSGKKIFAGHPADAEAKVRAAVGAALIEAADLGTPEKPLVPIVDGLKKGQSPLSALAKLQPLTRGSDATAMQARKLQETVLIGPKQKLDDAAAQVKDDPLAAYDAVQRIATKYKSTPIAAKANEVVTTLKADKAVQAELKARPLLDQVRKIDGQLALKAEKQDPKSAEFKKAFASPLRQMANAMQQLKRLAPEARATKEAEEIASKYDFGK